MKKIILVVAVLAMILSACERAPEVLTQENDYIKNSLEAIPGQYIVQLKVEPGYVKSTGMSYAETQQAMTVIAKNMLTASGLPEGELLQVYGTAISGFAVKLSDSEVAKLANHPEVKAIYPDMMFILAKPAPVPTPLPAEVTPPGINRVGGPVTSTGKRAWIIDTGIDLDHQDLVVDVANSKTFVPRTTSADDDNGHGTHCAGIVAAIDNSVGVVGVAAGATVVPVKVLDKRGSGAMSTIISGVDYVTSNAPAGDAANMSLGGGAYYLLDQAVYAMGQKGIFVSLAAGNESDDANNHSPARVNGSNIYTVSACDVNDIWAYFSNFGNPPIDFCAPGVYVRSTYKNNTLATMSGTSMAAPHVCGVLLVTGGKPKSKGVVINDPDDDMDDPIVHTTGL